MSARRRSKIPQHRLGIEKIFVLGYQCSTKKTAPDRGRFLRGVVVNMSFRPY